MTMVTDVESPNKTFLIYGVSQGLGKAIAEKIIISNDKIYGVSRSEPQLSREIEWIKADLAHPLKASIAVKSVIQDKPLDVLIYNVGIWEHSAFTDAYNFSSISASETQTIIDTNITSCILSIQYFLDNLQKSKNAKVILIGSTWGLDHHNGQEVIFSATKFALRGIAHSLREITRKDSIGVTVLNLGYLATEYDVDTPLKDILESSNQSLIPLLDVVAAINFVISTSRATCVKEIIMPAMQDRNI